MGRKEEADQQAGGSAENCTTCRGAKKIQVTEEHEDSGTVTEHEVTCPQCGGTGRRS